MAADGKSSNLIHPVILCGGMGTRLWPLSRRLMPKPFIRLTGPESLLQATASRVADAGCFAPPLAVCHEDHRFLVAEQLHAAGRGPRAIVLEPAGRGTAPAAAVAALLLTRDGGDPLLLVLPSDHQIGETDSFLRAVETAGAAARAGGLATFGVPPDAPESGYGYIHRGAPSETVPGCYRIARFVEKPEPARAQAMLDEGGWDWNSGMFLFGARAFLEEFERLQPDAVAACRRALEGAAEDQDFVRLEPEVFEALPEISIDRGIMERTSRAVVVPALMAWHDVGSWQGLWDASAKDQAGNVIDGDVLAEQVSDCYIRSDRGLVAALGVRDLAIVATDDAVLVTAKTHAREVGGLVERLQAAGRSEHVSHKLVHRPWGYYRSLETNGAFQVKEIGVKPGAKLSLQKHFRRAEHWVIVEGTARVTVGERTFDLEAQQATFIPCETVHRLENATDSAMRLIEVQVGDYFGEDDIVRLEDSYGRVEA